MNRSCIIPSEYDFEQTSSMTRVTATTDCIIPSELVESCSYECRSLSRKGMSCRCVLLTRRFLIRGCIEVRLPQFKATPPPPEFSFLRAGIATVANESVIV